MPVLSLGAIADDGYRERLTKARAAYLDDRFDESVHLSVGVYIDLLRADPSALEGTRLDRTNRFGIWPDYGITLADAGTPSVRPVEDGRAHTMASAVCYYEYVLEAVILAGLRLSGQLKPPPPIPSELISAAAGNPEANDSLREDDPK